MSQLSQSSVMQLLATRAPGAAVVSLFSEADETAAILRRAERVRSRGLAEFVRASVSRIREALLAQVPCEDVTFSAVSVYAVRRSTHT